MTKRLDLLDVNGRRLSSPDGYWVRFSAEGEELGWSRIGYTGENAGFLHPPVAFYVEFDSNGTLKRFVSCLLNVTDAQWAEQFGYGEIQDRLPVPDPKCNSPEPAATPAAKSLTSITRSFCR